MFNKINLPNALKNIDNYPLNMQQKILDKLKNEKSVTAYFSFSTKSEDEKLQFLKEKKKENPDSIKFSSLDDFYALPQSCIDYISKNFKNTKIVLERSEVLSIDELNKIKKMQEKFPQNTIYLKGSDIDRFYGIDEIENANNQLDAWSEEINEVKIDGKPLSPLEKFYYAYNIVTNRLYKKSIILNNARSVVAILNGDRIVCVGYAKLLQELCKRIGIHCMTNSMDYTNPLNNKLFGAHAACWVEITDEKYGLKNEIFFSDPTFDCLDKGKTSISHALVSYKDLCVADPAYVFNENSNSIDFTSESNNLKLLQNVDKKTKQFVTARIVDYIGKIAKNTNINFTDSANLTDSTKLLANQICTFYNKMKNTYARQNSNLFEKIIDISASTQTEALSRLMTIIGNSCTKEMLDETIDYIKEQVINNDELCNKIYDSYYSYDNLKKFREGITSTNSLSKDIILPALFNAMKSQSINNKSNLSDEQIIEKEKELIDYSIDMSILSPYAQGKYLAYTNDFYVISHLNKLANMTTNSENDKEK